LPKFGSDFTPQYAAVRKKKEACVKV